ncbi:MAG: FAD-dependent oxidoreductase [Candidatus Pacearchaeota archaeon]|jgi:thioredoxin reductase (NADPH)
MEEYDLIIIGGGPAGLSAAIYAARYKLKTAVFSKTIGGIAATAHKIYNYPSYKEIKGFELMQKFIEQVKGLEVPIIYNEIIEVKRQKTGFVVFTKKASYFCKKLLMAMGTVRKKLGVPGEAGLSGKGVSYCATCDGTLFKDKTVAIIGGSDAALTSALLLAEYSTKVYIIYRRDKFFRAEPSWISLVEKNKKIECIFNEEITKINGKERVEGVDLKSGKKLKLDGVFIEAGSLPKIEFVSDLKIEKDKEGYVLVDKTQKTNEKGVYAAGDITNNVLKQIVTAGAEGAIAAYSIYQEIKKDSQE